VAVVERVTKLSVKPLLFIVLVVTSLKVPVTVISSSEVSLDIIVGPTSGPVIVRYTLTG
jgi:hypothetical protein